MVQSHIQPNPCHPLTILYNAKHCCHQRFLLYSSIHFGGLARRGWLVTTMWANRSLDSATSIYWNRSGVVLRKRSKFSMVHMLRNTCRQSGLCCQRGNRNILDKCGRLDLGHGNRSHTVYNRKNTMGVKEQTQDQYILDARPKEDSTISSPDQRQFLRIWVSGIFSLNAASLPFPTTQPSASHYVGAVSSKK